MVARDKRSARTHSQLLQPGMDRAYTPAGYAQADLNQILAGIRAEIRETETRLFDPNYGEWASVPPGNPSSSFGSLLNFLLQSIYRLGSVQYLSVIHFPLKAGQR